MTEATNTEPWFHLLQQAQGFEFCAFYHSNGIKNPYSAFDWILACGHDGLSIQHPEFNQLLDWIEKHESEYRFGVLGYDLKNAFENLESNNQALLDTPDAVFFVPQHLYRCKNGLLECVLTPFPELVREPVSPLSGIGFEWKSLCPESEYFHNFEKIQTALQQGDLYEINYCRAFETQLPQNFNGPQAFARLLDHNPSAFSAYFKAGRFELLCASPERFLWKENQLIISEPIKGTAARSPKPETDKQLAQNLLNSEKERRENVMIVDLVRNDLSRICHPGTVGVESLFEIRSLPHVHQMVSTICGQLNPNTGFGDIIKACFPMGSMTGAPKIAAMELAEKLENFKRGWYSGSVGYLNPNGDFDFNVIIRSIVTDHFSRKAYMAAGGAITILSQPESEWNETELKAYSVQNAFMRSDSRLGLAKH